MATLEEQFLSLCQQRGLQTNDIRFVLSTAAWRIGETATKTSRTLHYNGPAVGAAQQSGPGLIQQLHNDVAWHMAPGHGFGDGADGLQYHIVIDAIGIVHLARNLLRILWHCANQTGNAYSVAIHLPLGGNQEATAAQWRAFCIVDQVLRAMGFGGEDDSYGHQEWAGAATACPGLLMDDLIAWRNNNGADIGGAAPAAPAPAAWQTRSFYRITGDGVQVRRGPTTADEPFAHFDMDDGIVQVDKKVRGTRVQRDPQSATIIDTWLRVLPGQGYPGDGGYFSAAYAELHQRAFQATINANIRAKTNADATTPLVNVPEYGGTQVPAGKLIYVAEEIRGKVPNGYTSDVWYRLAGRTVYVYSELFEER